MSGRLTCGSTNTACAVTYPVSTLTTHLRSTIIPTATKLFARAGRTISDCPFKGFLRSHRPPSPACTQTLILNPAQLTNLEPFPQIWLKNRKQILCPCGLRAVLLLFLHVCICGRERQGRILPCYFLRFMTWALA